MVTLSGIRLSYLDAGHLGPPVVELGGLRLALRWDGELGEVELGALGVGADEVGLLRVQERERLAARPVRVDAHGRARRLYAFPMRSILPRMLIIHARNINKSRRRSSHENHTGGNSHVDSIRSAVVFVSRRASSGPDGDGRIQIPRGLAAADAALARELAPRATTFDNRNIDRSMPTLQN